MAITRLLRFIQLLPRVPPDGEFHLKDLPGSGGRVDILCRELAACFDWAPEKWPRNNIQLIAMISNEVVLTFNNPGQDMPIGERAWAETIRKSLKGEAPSFVTRTESTLDELTGSLIDMPENRLCILDEGGVPLSEMDIAGCSTQNSFMLGDHLGFDSVAQLVIREFDLPRVSLGATSYLSSHCIANVISAFEKES